MILFLNKADLLKEKLADPKQQIATWWPEYPGKPGSFMDAVDYFKAKFRAVNRTQSKEIYIQWVEGASATLMPVSRRRRTVRSSRSSWRP